MNDIIVVAEIEKTTRLSGVIATPFQSPIWKYDLWLLSYVKTLPFMAAADSTYPILPYAFSNLLVDYNPYYSASSYAECAAVLGSYFLDGATLYVHGTDDRPVWSFLLTQYGRLYGFTNKGVKRYNQVTYLPLVSGVPDVSEGADPIEYSRMAFKSGTLTLRNDLETFDAMASVFGNDVNLKVGPDGEYSELRKVSKYYIDTYVTGLGETKFSLKDKRELLSAKAPNTYFNATSYPNIQDEVIDKVIPDAFGELLGVPGTCVNGKSTASAKVFKFAALITRLDRVYVYKSEKWTEVTPTATSLSTGEVTLSTTDAHVDGSTAKGIVKVKADGLFRAEVNPGDVIAKINSLYGGIEYLPGNYDIAEWEAELAPLADIALYMDEAKDVSDWIEAIQNGSTVGFQYLVEYDRITARIDNPNRDISRRIKPVEIVNAEDVEVDYNANIYASSALVRYGPDQAAKEARQVINDEFKAAVLEVHRKEKQYECDSLLPSSADATVKAAVIMDDQKDIRPIFRNVKVWGLDWLAVRLYDIVEAEISLPGIVPRVPWVFDKRVVVSDSSDVLEIRHDAVDSDLLVFLGARGRITIPGTTRTFVGTVRCQVVNIRRNIADCTVSLDLRQRDYSAVVESAIGA